jgi:hypothetical protein
LSSELNIKNKLQLCKHFLLHSKQESTGKKKKQKALKLTEKKEHKLVSIASTLYLVAVGLIKKSEYKPDDEIFKAIEAVFRNCLIYDDYRLNRIASEGLVLFYKPYLMSDPDFVMSIISDLEL